MAFLILSAVSGLLLVAIAILLWVRRPPAPLWPIAFACQVFALLWVGGDLWATHAHTPDEKQLALFVLFSGSLLLPAAWWTTARRYVVSHGLGRAWMRSRWARLPVWFAAAAWLLMATNPWHGAFIEPVIGGPNHYRWGILAALYGNYLIAGATTLLCAWAARRHSVPDVRRRMTLLAVATLAPAVFNLLHLSLGTGPREDTTALGLGIASATILYGISRRRLFNPQPVALEEILRRDPAGLLVLDRGGRLLRWNPAAEQLLQGLPLEPDLPLLRTLAGRLETRDGGRLRSSRELTQRLTGTGAPAPECVMHYVGGSTERWLGLSVTPLPGRRGKLIAACLRIEDVTRRVLAERAQDALTEQVQRAEKLRSLGLVAGGVAHDFNNLLTVIGGSAELALEQLPEGSKLHRHLEEIQEATGVAVDLTGQLLAYAGRRQVAWEPVALSELVSETVRLLSGSLPRKTTVELELAGDLPWIEGDPTQLRQIVMNLLTNGAEAIGEDSGFVRVRTLRVALDAARLRAEDLDECLEEGEHVVLEVSDSGCGMDEQTRQRIFDPFFSTKLSGRGLGLAAVYGIVRAHRGAIDVQSAPQGGATVRVWLPGRPLLAPAVEARGSLRTTTAERWRGQGRVLVVDDQPRLRRIARVTLEQAGFEVITASDGAEAIQRLREQAGEVCAVLLDLTMPRMGGDATLREIQRIDPSLRVILTSGFDESDAGQLRSLEPGWHFLHKPWRPSELVATLRRVLEEATSA